jgi:LysR family glycine cleavage system transcriptional activator
MLIAFEAAARHGSFTRAAQELFLTQSAVCRQIAGLEEFLGVPLFRRARQGVRLTEAGLAYSRQMAARLDEVERDTLAIMAHGGRGTTLELAVVPTFATRWLMPRLARRQRESADFTVNMTTRTRPFLFAETEFDAAIYYGTPDWPGTEAHFLMPENAVPVCSPGLRARLGVRKPTPANIARLPLLQQSTRPYAWRQWFGAQGVEAENDLNGPRLELFSMLAEAAMHDMGAALVPPFLIQDEIASGRLLVLSERTVESDKAYYLIVPRNRSASAALQAFREWIVAEAASFRPAPAEAAPG